MEFVLTTVRRSTSRFNKSISEIYHLLNIAFHRFIYLHTRSSSTIFDGCQGCWNDDPIKTARCYFIQKSTDLQMVSYIYGSLMHFQELTYAVSPLWSNLHFFVFGRAIPMLSPFSFTLPHFCYIRMSI